MLFLDRFLKHPTRSFARLRFQQYRLMAAFISEKEQQLLQLLQRNDSWSAAPLGSLAATLEALKGFNEASEYSSIHLPDGGNHRAFEQWLRSNGVDGAGIHWKFDRSCGMGNGVFSQKEFHVSTVFI